MQEVELKQELEEMEAVSTEVVLVLQEVLVAILQEVGVTLELFVFDFFFIVVFGEVVFIVFKQEEFMDIGFVLVVIFQGGVLSVGFLVVVIFFQFVDIFVVDFGKNNVIDFYFIIYSYFYFYV